MWLTILTKFDQNWRIFDQDELQIDQNNPQNLTKGVF